MGGWRRNTYKRNIIGYEAVKILRSKSWAIFRSQYRIELKYERNILEDLELQIALMAVWTLDYRRKDWKWKIGDNCEMVKWEVNEKEMDVVIRDLG